MATDPAEYSWSGYNAEVHGRKDKVVDFHSTYSGQGESEDIRQKSYAEYVLGTVPEYKIKLIREAL